MTKPSSVFDFSLRDIDGHVTSLRNYSGQVLLIVNTASQCGFTPQYQQLEHLHQRLSERGFSVLGFPCNQFGGQEPGDANEIKTFCQTKYGVTFPLFSKVEVNGSGAEPLFEYLKNSCPGVLGSSAIKWNFTKFLIDRSGKPIRRFAPTTAPDAIFAQIDALL